MVIQPISARAPVPETDTLSIDAALLPRRRSLAQVRLSLAYAGNAWRCSGPWCDLLSASSPAHRVCAGGRALDAWQLDVGTGAMSAESQLRRYLETVAWAA